MGKRASTDHSFVLGIDKPVGMTSHDVVDRCRRIYGERRIGHTGTLDPDASGVLLVCVGPATRLDQFLVGQGKVYEFVVVLGISTDTDDAQGQITQTSPVPDWALDEGRVQEFLRGFQGDQMQIPPSYSAIRSKGARAYEMARAGQAPVLQARKITVRSLDLLDISQDPASSTVAWHARADVSSGTYIRSLARDIGRHAGTCAHARAIRRTQTGVLRLDECVSLEALERDPFGYLVDPVRLLRQRLVFVDGQLEAYVENGRPLPQDMALPCTYEQPSDVESELSCTNGLQRSHIAFLPGELLSIISRNRLKALYEYDKAAGLLKCSCMFSIGVQRGSYI